MMMVDPWKALVLINLTKFRIKKQHFLHENQQNRVSLEMKILFFSTLSARILGHTSAWVDLEEKKGKVHLIVRIVRMM